MRPHRIEPDFTDADVRIEFEERAGILEFDLGLTRLEAERLALEIIRKRKEPQPGLFGEK
jgi:hypothetical protein